MNVVFSSNVIVWENKLARKRRTVDSYKTTTDYTTYVIQFYGRNNM